MLLIRIQERSETLSGWNATVSFDHGPEYIFTLSNPFSHKQESDLEWYFEDYLRFPFTNRVRAQSAAVSITDYGEALFKQIFADPEAYAHYRSSAQAGLNTLQFEIVGSPTFHALHWEALKDPDLTHPLSLQTIMVRKNLVTSLVQAALRSSPTINLLIVTAHPSGKRDVGYRTISRPVVEALGQAGIPVQIEVLRPGTYEALDKHLREITAQRGVGYYHVIHFDVHGALLSYEELQQVQQTERYLYQQRYGRPDLQPFEGDKAFLFFEEKQDQKADPVEAAEVAALLLSHQTPIAILNACQSGKQIGASEASLGSRLIQTGVQLVLAMGYSVTVSAAELMMRTLYQQLFANHQLSAASNPTLESRWLIRGKIHVRTPTQQTQKRPEHLFALLACVLMLPCFRRGRLWNCRVLTDSDKFSGNPFRRPDEIDTPGGNGALRHRESTGRVHQKLRFPQWGRKGCRKADGQKGLAWSYP